MRQGPQVEVISRGPDRGRWPRGPGSGRLRAAASVVALAVALGALWLTSRHHLATSEAGTAGASPAAALAATQTVYPAPDITAGLPVRHDLAISLAPDQRSFIAFSTHILLFFDVTYAGATPVRLVDGRVPQHGAYPDAGAGGLTAGATANVSLRRGISTEVFVRTRVDCTQVLTGQPVGHLDLLTKASNGTPSAQFVDLSRLGSYWDEARRAACSRADAAGALSVGVGALVASPASPWREPRVEMTVSLHNRDGLEAVAVLIGAAQPGIRLIDPAPTRAGVAVDGGGTLVAKLRWVVLDCAAALAGPAPSLDFQVRVADSRAQVRGDGATFATSWRTAIGQACR